ncbi:MAG: helix-turn-helix domain-containing protein, partial [Pyrobaculum sp.]
MKKEVVELVAMLKEFESPLRLLIALYHVDGYVTFTELYRYLDIPKSTLHSHLTELEKRG